MSTSLAAPPRSFWYIPTTAGCDFTDASRSSTRLANDFSRFSLSAADGGGTGASGSGTGKTPVPSL